MQAQFNFSPQQIKEYSECPDVNYMGGHLGGLSSCVYCAQIFRRYRLMNGQKLPTEENTQVQKYEQSQNYNEKESSDETKKFGNKIVDDQVQECGKLVCMKAGFCTCG